MSPRPQVSDGKWVVHKFGGTSVGSPAAFRRVLEIISGLPASNTAVVVSAMSGVTDRLIRCAQSAANQDPDYQKGLEQLFLDHQKTAGELLTPESEQKVTSAIQAEVKDLQEILRGVWLSRHLPETTLELVSGYGELWSSRILAELWGAKDRPADFPVKWIDARKILVVEHGETGPLILWDSSQNKMDQVLKENPGSSLVITGFIASTAQGVPTTLKRNGSDFSASIFGRLLRAKEIVIWTDVDGVYSADPRKVPEAACLKEISYEEAIELAYFGAKVIHPHTMGPAVDLRIPILIKNTFNPTAPGTFIHHIDRHDDGLVARGFTTVDQVSLINVEGNGMIGVPGVSQRLFGALREVSVSVILISQASSEHSICFAVPMSQSAAAKAAIQKAFASELEFGQIETVQEISPCSILALVGDNMVEKSGVAGRFFSALGNAGISVRAIAQGSSERNISAVIDQKEAMRALRATHSAFFLSDCTLSVGILGTGQIGQALIRQLESRHDVLQSKFNLDVRVRAISDSSRMLLDERAIPLSQWKEKWSEGSQSADLEKFAAHIKADHIPHCVMIDCTASDSVAELYGEWLSQGFHIITPNKKLGSGPWQRYLDTREKEKNTGRSFLCEATVGAGLPVIATLRELLMTGDELISVEGIVSGTLSYLFNSYQPGDRFSEWILKAKALGFTEPDPRDDLSGMDVGRKMVILAREAGFALSLSGISVESLVPAPLKDLPIAKDFLSRIAEIDESMTKRLETAKKRGKVLRYTGFVGANGEARAGLNEFDFDHPFARVQGTDNMIAFRTRRYDKQPLIIQGPGAGPDVTAGGIFGDLLRLARSLGAKA